MCSACMHMVYEQPRSRLFCTCACACAGARAGAGVYPCACAQVKQADTLKSSCDAVRDSKELKALMQIVLDVGNALNSGTAKGNAVGFKLSTLLKLAELKAMDKKTTLLHFVVDVVRSREDRVKRV